VKIHVPVQTLFSSHCRVQLWPHRAVDPGMQEHRQWMQVRGHKFLSCCSRSQSGEELSGSQNCKHRFCAPKQPQCSPFSASLPEPHFWMKVPQCTCSGNRPKSWLCWVSSEDSCLPQQGPTHCIWKASPQLRFRLHLSPSWMSPWMGHNCKSWIPSPFHKQNSHGLD